MDDAFNQGTQTREPARAGRQDRLARLLELAQGGETAALHDVVRELDPLLWHVARSQGLAAEEAADVVQATWLELVRRLHEIRSPRALTAWLVATARRDAMRVHRAGRRHVPDGSDLVAALADPGPELGERLIADERHRVLLRHLRTLSARCQALLRVVAQVHRPDYDSVAEALDMPRGSIGPTRGRCLARLRELLLADPQWSTE